MYICMYIYLSIYLSIYIYLWTVFENRAINGHFKGMYTGECSDHLMDSLG